VTRIDRSIETYDTGRCSSSKQQQQQQQQQQQAAAAAAAEACRRCTRYGRESLVLAPGVRSFAWCVGSTMLCRARGGWKCSPNQVK